MWTWGWPHGGETRSERCSKFGISDGRGWRQLEEERTKANQHTVEKIGFLARDMQRAKDAMHLNNEKLKTVQAAVEPLIEKVSWPMLIWRWLQSSNTHPERNAVHPNAGER